MWTVGSAGRMRPAMRFPIFIAALAGLTALGACARQGVEINSPGDLTFENAQTWFNRAYAESYQDKPFDEGVVHVVANEHGDLHTYSLVRCRGDRICGGAGHVGRLQVTPDYYVVTGAYPNRTFYLSPGGDGYLSWRGESRVLAWE